MSVPTRWVMRTSGSPAGKEGPEASGPASGCPRSSPPPQAATANRSRRRRTEQSAARMVPLAPAPQSRVCALTTLRFLRAVAADRRRSCDTDRMADRFPASVVGSMSRPHFVRDLLDPERAPRDPAALAARMDAAVDFVVALQEQAGLDVVTDGEYRR